MKMITDINSLKDYYAGKAQLIERSIDSILPRLSNYESMNHIVGPGNHRWDFKTLQHSFFTPAYEYMITRTDKIICLSTCLFLEAAGMDLNRFIPILAIPLYFETSNEIFRDIAHWTNTDDPEYGKIPVLDISIKGNVAIALLSLPTHNLLFHRLETDPEKLLKLYESLTSNVFNSLFGNGLSLFWEQSGNIPANLSEYYEAASLLNKGFLRFGGDLWLTFHEKPHDEMIRSALNNFVEKRAVLIQLKRDLQAFERLQTGQDKVKSDQFNTFSNILIIHSIRKLNYNGSDLKNIADEKIFDLIENAGSVKFVEGQIYEFERISDNALTLLPMEEYFKELLKSYCEYMVAR